MQKLQQQDKKREKKMAQLQVYELLNTIFLENLNDIQQLLLTPADIQSSNKEQFRERTINVCLKNLLRCHKVRIYANQQLARISSIYSQTVGMIDMNFRTVNQNIRLVGNLNSSFVEIPENCLHK